MTDTENMRLQADLAMANEKVVALERECNILQSKLITGEQLAEAQTLRATGKTKKEIADIVGVEHQALASLLGGVDSIVNRVTAGKVEATKLEEANKRAAELEAVMAVKDEQLVTLGKVNEANLALHEEINRMKSVPDEPLEAESSSP